MSNSHHRLKEEQKKQANNLAFALMLAWIIAIAGLFGAGLWSYALTVLGSGLAMAIATVLLYAEEILGGRWK